MFKYIKNKIVSLMLMLGIFTSFVNASVPDAPGPYIGATKIDDTSVLVNFNDNSDNETGFKIFGDINMSLPANDETINPNVQTNITGLICNKVYQIEVIAYNDDGNSPSIGKRTFRMSTTFGVECNVTDVPTAPGPYIGVSPLINPVTQEKSKTAVRINFEDHSDNETGFKIFGDINMSLPANDETISPQVYKTVTGLTCDKLYTIQALAYNAHGDSLPSDERAFNIHTTFGIDCDDNNTSPIPHCLNPITLTPVFD